MKESNDLFATNLLSVLRDLLKYWYLILLSVIIAVVFAFFYLKYAANTYKVHSSILLHIERQNNYTGNSNDILKAFDFIVQDKSFNNQIAFLQSTPLIREVVRSMDLRTTYYLQEDMIPKELTFSLKDVYKDSPFIVIPNEKHVQPVYVYFYVKILNEEMFYISAIEEEAYILDIQTEQTVKNSVFFKLDGIYHFGDQIENENCSFKLILNSNFDPVKYTGKDLFFRFNNLENVASGFKKFLSVETSGLESTLVRLVLKTYNVRKGIDFLNTLISMYVERNLEEANFLSNKTIEYIDNQLVNISDSLGMSEQQLQSLRSSYSVMNIDEKAQNLYGQIQTFQLQRDEAQRKLNYLRQMNEYFTSYKDSSRLLAPSSLGLSDPLLNNLIQELTSLNAEKQRIISQDQLRNPRLQTIDISINNLKNVISENLSFSISTTNRELDELTKRITNLNQEFNHLPATQRRLLGLERKFNLNDAIYTSLLEKRFQAQILKASRLPDVKVIEPPEFLTIASPKRIIVLFFAFFLGMFVPTLVIFIKKLIINKVSHIDEIKSLSRYKLIGYIPHNSKELRNVVMNYPRSAIAEAFHTLRSNLVYYLFGEKRKVILVTSTLPGEGKSFTAINLASSFAATNNKTILVEFDLRRPSKIFNEFGNKGLVGVSSYLINRANLNDIIMPTEIPNLDIIQAGQMPPNPIELISGARTADLLEELKRKYDYIILDTPPYGLVTDSFLLMNYADLKLFITRLRYTKKRAFSTIMEDMEQKKIENIFLMINDDSEKRLGYSGYSYKEDNGKVNKSQVQNSFRIKKVS